MMNPSPEVMSEEFKPSSERLAEELEQARRYWQKRRGAEMELGPLRGPPFTIALSDEAGANGPAVARAIGDRLHWHVYDHELVEWIARNLGVRAQLLDSVDERRMPWLLEILHGFQYERTVSQTAYVYQLAQVLLSLAAQGECIIVGRGAAQLLPPNSTLRLRLVGPRKDRVAAIQRYNNWSRDQAERWVDETDQERKAFVQEHFHKDPTDPEQYDLLANAFRYSTGQCAEFAETALLRLRDNALTASSG